MNIHHQLSIFALILCPKTADHQHSANSHSNKREAPLQEHHCSECSTQVAIGAMSFMSSRHLPWCRDVQHSVIAGKQCTLLRWTCNLAARILLHMMMPPSLGSPGLWRQWSKSVCFHTYLVYKSMVILDQNQEIFTKRKRKAAPAEGQYTADICPEPPACETPALMRRSEIPKEALHWVWCKAFWSQKTCWTCSQIWWQPPSRLLVVVPAGHRSAHRRAWQYLQAGKHAPSPDKILSPTSHHSSSLAGACVRELVLSHSISRLPHHFFQAVELKFVV